MNLLSIILSGLFSGIICILLIKWDTKRKKRQFNQWYAEETARLQKEYSQYSGKTIYYHEVNDGFLNGILSSDTGENIEALSFFRCETCIHGVVPGILPCKITEFWAPWVKNMCKGRYNFEPIDFVEEYDILGYDDNHVLLQDKRFNKLTSIEIWKDQKLYYKLATGKLKTVKLKTTFEHYAGLSGMSYKAHWDIVD